MAQSKRHHVVSQGLQRRWGSDDERIQLIFKNGTRSKVTAIENSLLQSYFNSVLAEEGDHDDHLEREWSRLEGEAFPVLDELLGNVRSLDDARVDQELKVLIAMHVARSFSTRLLHDEIVANFGPGFTEQMLKNRRLRDGWRRQYGTAPTREVLGPLIEAMLQSHQTANDLYIPRQISVYNQLLEAYKDRHLQFLTSPSERLPFLLGDVPAVPVAGIRVGIHNGVGAATAERIQMPIHPRLAVVLRREPADPVQLTAAQTQFWNRDTWRCAIRFLVAPVGTDWKLAAAL